MTNCLLNFYSSKTSFKVGTCEIHFCIEHPQGTHMVQLLVCSCLYISSVVFNTEEGGHPRERTRRSSDSVVYVPQIANEASAVILKLKQTEIKFHLEQKESLAKEIVKLKEELKEAKAFKQIPEETIGKKNIALFTLCMCCHQYKVVVGLQAIKPATYLFLGALESSSARLVII